MNNKTFPLPPNDSLHFQPTHLLHSVQVQDSAKDLNQQKVANFFKLRNPQALYSEANILQQLMGPISSLSCLPDQPSAPISFCSIKDYYFCSVFGLLPCFIIFFDLVLWPLICYCFAVLLLCNLHVVFFSCFWM